MSVPVALDKIVTVNSRFARSVSLPRDFGRLDALEGYNLTPTGREVLRRVGGALQGTSITRAWSLTGPYGSGKSSFALFCAQLLGGEERIRSRARLLLEEAAPELAHLLFSSGSKLAPKLARFCCVLVTGSRQPLAKALARNLAASLRRLLRQGRPPQIIKRLERLAAQENPASAEVVALFEEANDYLAGLGAASAGILLIVDELGKFLEFGASSPERGDVFVLQELAESATRSKRPFLFLTILHQTIDRYADLMSPGRRAEWSKVQGRFQLHF